MGRPLYTHRVVPHLPEYEILQNSLMCENIVVGKAFKLKDTNSRIENNIIIDGEEEGVVILANAPDCGVYRNILINSRHILNHQHGSWGSSF